MSTRIDENPITGDLVVIPLNTPDADGCYLANPYRVDNVKIFYVERDYSNRNYSQYDQKIYDDTLKTQLDAAIAAACADPSDENLAEVEKLSTLAESTSYTQSFYYNEAKTIAIYGNEDYPAWLSTDPDSENNSIVNIDEDEEGNAQYGRFELTWDTGRAREGDYFVCWTWTPNYAGNPLVDSLHFSLSGNTQLTTSIPTHFTNPNKYYTLMERYLPEMFKLKLGDEDLTPEVLQELNNSVADGFTFLENLANQIIDLIDSNATHEAYLPLLGNLFDLKLKTQDPTLWRRQIKNAVSLYKKKGTYNGLVEALAQAGITMTRFARLWQVLSKYTYQDAFVYSDSNSFDLTRIAVLPIDTDNFELYLRAADADTWTQLDETYVSFNTSDGVTTMTWIDDPLTVGDEIRVVYQFNEVPNIGEQNVEDYIRTLPLADQRDEFDQEYPLKNWNIRVIEEDDPLLDLVLPMKHPFFNSLFYGKIRTEFPYSENIYNMEEYNGSTRDSLDPCDIDKDFMDFCESCLGSKFTIDLEIENLSNDRILEAQDILEEFMPFHSLLHSINITGTMNEFVPTPVEDMDILASMRDSEYILAGNAQTIFNRSMTSTSQFKRNELASVIDVVLNGTGNGYNTEVCLFSPNTLLHPALNPNSAYNYLEVLSPSGNAGTYGLSNIERHYAEVATSVAEPIDTSAFTFRLSNLRATKTGGAIYQDDVFNFSDANFDFWKLSIKTQWDVDNTDYSGGPWKVAISAYSDEYEIINILSDGSLILNDPSQTLPTSNTSNINYILKKDDNSTVVTSSSGRLVVKRRGRVDMTGSISVNGNTVTLNDVRDLMDSYHDSGSNHYVKYLTTQYLFDGFVEGSTGAFYIADYTAGDAVGVNFYLYQRLINNEKGYFAYRGAKIITSDNHETGLGICNGENAGTLFAAVDAQGDNYILQKDDDHFYQNYLILINSNYYAISKIDGTSIWLVGPEITWELAGTAITYDILWYSKAPVSIPERDYPITPGHDFDFIDRRGNEVIDTIIENAPSMAAFNVNGEVFEIETDNQETPTPAIVHLLNADSQPTEVSGQRESITFTITIR